MRKIRQITPQQKRKITIYFNHIKEQLSRPHVIYRPKIKKKLIAAKKATGKNLANLKVAIVPAVTMLDEHGRRVARPMNIDVKFKGIETITKSGKVKIKKIGRLFIKSDGIYRMVLPFESFGISKIDVIADPESAIEKMLEQTDFDYYSILAGGFEAGRKPGSGIAVHIPKKFLIEETIKLLSRYDGGDGCDPNDPSSHHYHNWFQGFVGYKFESYAEIEQDIHRYKNIRKRKEKISGEIKKILKKLRRAENRLKKARNRWGIFKKMSEGKVKADIQKTEIKKEHYSDQVKALLIDRTKF